MPFDVFGCPKVTNSSTEHCDHIYVFIWSFPIDFPFKIRNMIVIVYVIILQLQIIHCRNKSWIYQAFNVYGLHFTPGLQSAVCILHWPESQHSWKMWPWKTKQTQMENCLIGKNAWITNGIQSIWTVWLIKIIQTGE